jgi:hypothetical protein
MSLLPGTPKCWQLLVAALLVSIGAAGFASAAGKPPPSEILGIHPGMPEEEAHRRLVRIGELQEGKVSNKKGRFEQNWKLRDARFANLLVRFDSKHRVKWLTGYVREGVHVRYDSIADTTLAARTGRYIYRWTVEAREGRPGGTLLARGSSPAFLSSLSLSGFVPIRNTADSDSISSNDPPSESHPDSSR